MRMYRYSNLDARASLFLVSLNTFAFWQWIYCPFCYALLPYPQFRMYVLLYVLCACMCVRAFRLLIRQHIGHCDSKSHARNALLHAPFTPHHSFACSG
jgi:hypothetical protein